MKINEPHLLHLSLQAKRSGRKFGYLSKKSGKKSTPPDHTAVRWQIRWCAVYCNIFFYFENEHSVKPQGILFLEDVYCEESDSFDKNLYCFLIGTSKDDSRQYLFACETEKERQEWMNEIRVNSWQNQVGSKNELTSNLEALKSQVESLTAEREKLRYEVSNQWQEISRLKLQLSTLRKKYDEKKDNKCANDAVGSEKPSPFKKSEGTESIYSSDDIQKIIKIQAFVRGTYARSRWKQFMENLIGSHNQVQVQNRNKLLWQFTAAVEDCLSQMGILVKHFLNPMKRDAYSRGSYVNVTEFKQIYLNSESILFFHKMFMKHIDSRIDLWPNVPIDDIVDIISSTLPVYTDYLKNHPNAIKVLMECKKRTAFVKLLTLIEKKSECNGQTLEHLLHYPTQVVPSYIRSVHSILEVTPPNNVERTLLEGILEKLQETQSYLHHLDESESLCRTLEIERLIEGGCCELLDPNQKFIRHGVLKQIGLEKNDITGKIEKIRHCFLFSHHLIVTSRTVEGKLRLSKKSGIISLANATLSEEMQWDKEMEACISYFKELAFTITINKLISAGETEELYITLVAAKSNEKALWVSDITQCILNLSFDESSTENTSSDSVAMDSVSQYSKDTGICLSLAENEDNKKSVYDLPLKEDHRLRENADDIIYHTDEEGIYQLPTIQYASVDRLIERLSDPRLPGADFMETFLLTYKAFTTSEYVIEGLKKFYWQVMSGKPTDVQASKRNLDGSSTLTTTTTRTRGRSLMSSASFSSLDELELSFGSYCQTSTAFFSYKDLKDILTPTKALHTDPFASADPDESQHAQDNEISESPDDNTNSKSHSENEVDSRLADKRWRSASVEVILVQREDELTRDNVTPIKRSCSFRCGSSSEARHSKIVKILRKNTSNKLTNNSDPLFHTGTREEALIQDQENNNISSNLQAGKKKSRKVPDLLISRAISLVSKMETEKNENNQSNNNLEIPTSPYMGAYSDLDLAVHLLSESNGDNSSEASCETSKVQHSYSDEAISKSRSASDINMYQTKSNSLDKKKSQFMRKWRKEIKEKEKIKKIRSVSDANVRNFPALLNVKDLESNTYLSQAKPETLPENSPRLEKKPLEEHCSLPISKSDNDETTDKKVSPRKRSIFNTSFPFRFGTLRRTSSEQVLTINEMMDKKLNKSTEISVSTSDISKTGTHNMDVIKEDHNQNQTPVRPFRISQEKLQGNGFFSKNSKRSLAKRKRKISTKIFSSAEEKLNFPENSDSIKEQQDESNVERRNSMSSPEQPTRRTRQSYSIYQRGPLKIMSIFKHWLAKHPKDIVGNPGLLGILEEFFSDIKRDSRTLPVVLEIVTSLEKSVATHRNSLSTVNPVDELLIHQQTLHSDLDNETQSQPNDPSYKPLHTYSFRTVAETMTLLEHHLYSKISFHEFISCQWTKKDKETKAPGIMNFISRFNMVTKMVSYHVVHGETPEIRASYIEFWIRVAAHCRDLNNFNAVMEIISALNASAVHRLKKSWGMVSRTMRDFFSDLESLVTAERSFKNLRHAIHMCNPPCVPYLGFYLSDILFLHDGAKTFDENQLVNFAKMHRIWRQVREIRCYQQLPYTFKLHKEIGDALVNQDTTVDEDLLYERSLEAEPRGS